MHACDTENFLISNSMGHILLPGINWDQIMDK